MQKERQESLEWFVQFANMNLSELKPGDKAKLIVESEEHLFPTKEVKALLPFAPHMIKTAQQATGVAVSEEDLKLLSEEMAWAFEQPPEKDSKEYWSAIVHLQDIVKRTLSLFVERAPIPGKGFDYATQTGHKTWAETVIVHSEWNYEKFIFSYIPLGKSHDDYIRIKINLLLDGLPRSNLQRCLAPKCGKYFVNISLRRKRFCSPRCMWRFNSARRRDEDSEGYREYQRKLMKDRYREKKGLKRLKTKSRKAKKGE